jgi:hypothetical protein
VAQASGRLTAVELAIETDGPLSQSEDATVIIAKDKHGFPGARLEAFSVQAKASPATGARPPVVIKSAKQPALIAGVKYWMCVTSPGGWRWHFNNRNIVQNSARELKPRKWVSAGDYCYVGAFSVMIETNQTSTTPDN